VARGTLSALQVAEKVLGGLSHLKQKMAKSGNALPKILTIFTVFYSLLRKYSGSNSHETITTRDPGTSSRVVPRGGKSERLMVRTPSAVKSSIEDLSTNTLR